MSDKLKQACHLKSIYENQDSHYGWGDLLFKSSFTRGEIKNAEGFVPIKSMIFRGGRVHNVKSGAFEYGSIIIQLINNDPSISHFLENFSKYLEETISIKSGINVQDYGFKPIIEYELSRVEIISVKQVLHLEQNSFFVEILCKNLNITYITEDGRSSYVINCLKQITSPGDPL